MQPGERFAAVGAASVADAMAERGADGVIPGPRLVLGSGPFVGTAVTVQLGDPAQAGPGDGRRVWNAIDTAAAGSVLVVSTGGGDITAVGGVTCGTAAARELAGVVTDGLARDVDEIAGYGLPVHFRRADPRVVRGSCLGTGGRVRFGAVDVDAGDLVVADGDGVVRVPRADVAAVMERAYAIERLERLWVDHARAYRSMAEGFDVVARRFGSPH